MFAFLSDPRRASLVRQVERGKLTPAEADEKAKARGLGPLLVEPDPEDYDPFDEPFWTVAMLVAWVAYREVGPVRTLMPRFTRATPRWLSVGPMIARNDMPQGTDILGQIGGMLHAAEVKQGWALIWSPPRCLFQMLYAEHMGDLPLHGFPEPIIPIEQAWGGVHHALQSDPYIVASATFCGEKAVRTVSPAQWVGAFPGIVQLEETGWTDSFEVNGAAIFHSPLVPFGAAILKGWPTSLSESRQPATKATTLRPTMWRVHQARMELYGENIPAGLLTKTVETEISTKALASTRTVRRYLSTFPADANNWPFRPSAASPSLSEDDDGSV